MQSEKQREYRRMATHRWNVKVGATRSGKTYGDYYMIPRRLIGGHGREGLNVILGNTKGTIQRNVIEPMQAIWGTGLVSDIRSDNTATLFGERCFCLGADNAKHVNRLRGTSLKYCYGDEVVTWHPDVFEMLKSRLDKPYSVFDGTCNPSRPEHWFKAFLDSGADIFQQTYTLDDNPFLDPAVAANIKREHAGSVYYDRYILGQWARAEGLVFPQFAENGGCYVMDSIPRRFSRVVIGVDFGGNGSMTCLCAVGYTGAGRLIVLDEDAVPLRSSIDADDICRRYVAFARRVQAAYAGAQNFTLCDSASPTMINSLVSAARKAGLNARGIRGCRKNQVSQRPLTVDRLLGGGRLFFSPKCKETMRALANLRWSEKRPDEPEDLNIGNINDRWDAFCYTWLDFVEIIDRR